jgi:hypothetical protein
MINVLAIPLFEWVPGADNSDSLSKTLRARNKLAMRYLAKGQPAKAIPLYKQTLVDCQRALGTFHPSTMASRINLATVYRAAGQPAEAISVLKRTLADCERVLGAGHPTTKAARADLAALTPAP